jgi:hypothetical protein
MKAPHFAISSTSNDINVNKLQILTGLLLISTHWQYRKVLKGGMIGEKWN